MKVGLALSGGGVRGAAHIGAIKALEENGIKIDAIAGTSAGSIVASLLGMGYTTDEMIKIFEYFSKSIMAISPKYMFNGIREKKGVHIGGITTSYNIESAVEEAGKLKNIKNINEIKIPIAIPATDLASDKEIIFTNCKDLNDEKYIHSIEIGKAVRASSTFPGMYAPFEYEKYQFVDGGIFNNLPVNEVKKMGIDKAIAIKFNLENPKKQKTIYNIVMKSIDLMSENLVKESIRKSDYVLEIDLNDVKTFNVGKLDFCYREGYMQTIDNISKIKKALGM